MNTPVLIYHNYLSGEWDVVEAYEHIYIYMYIYWVEVVCPALNTKLARCFICRSFARHGMHQRSPDPKNDTILAALV